LRPATTTVWVGATVVSTVAAAAAAPFADDVPFAPSDASDDDVPDDPGRRAVLFAAASPPLPTALTASR